MTGKAKGKGHRTIKALVPIEILYPKHALLVLLPIINYYLNYYFYYLS